MSRLADSLYAKLFAGEPEENARRDITAQAARETPRNFFAIIASLTLTKLGDALSNPKTVLAWLLANLGAPVAVTGLLVPVRESLSMLPQMAIAGIVRRQRVRKWVWVAGSLAQAAALAAIAVAALTTSGTTAGLAVLAGVAVFALARAFCSIAIKDTIGKTVPKTRRGRVTGYSAAASGGLALAASLLLVSPLGGGASLTALVVLLATATALWVVAATVFASIREFPAIPDNTDSQQRPSPPLALLRTDPAFRNFVLARALFLVSALSAPYYVVLAHGASGATSATSLGLFVLAAGLADLLSSPLWGKLADRSSRRVMMLASAIASVLGIAVAAATTYAGTLTQHPATLPTAYFLLSVAHAGVRAGRKTYVVDLGTGDRRTAYVAVSNTVIGAVLLAAGGLAAALPFPPAGILLTFSFLGLTGVAVAAKLPEVQHPNQPASTNTKG